MLPDLAEVTQAIHAAAGREPGYPAAAGAGAVDADGVRRVSINATA